MGEIDYKKILIIQLQPVGDVLRATPVIVKLKERYPEAEIAFLVYDRYAELLRANPRLNEIIPFNRKFRQEKIDANQTFKELKELTSRLQERGFDLVINLHNTTLSGILAYLVKGRETRGVVLNEYGHLLVPPGWLLAPDYQRTGLNMVEIYLKNVGLDTDGAKLEMYLEEEDLAFREGFLREKGVGDKDLLIGLNPGAAVYSRRWPMERFAEIGNGLTEEFNAKVIIFGSPREKELVKKVSNLMKYKPLEFYEAALRQLAVLIERCNLFITNDTGPMHMAAAMGTPIIAIFGSVLKNLSLPFASDHIALQADLPCIPCGRFYCEELNCLKSITVEEVLASCRKILEEEI